MWNGSACAAPGPGAEALARATVALDEFRVEDALPELERAREAGPHGHEVLVAIYEQLGIARAYVEDEAGALAAFDMLLALEPDHLLSYTLSPKVTFLFEQARASARAPSVAVSWPHGLRVTDAVPVDVEVVADPKSNLERAALHVRTKGADQFERVDLALPAPGNYERVVLPALDAEQPQVVQLYLTAYDATGNEVLVWADAEAPREIELGYQVPTPWYRKWWVWAAGGVAVAGVTGATFFAIGQGPPDTVSGGLDVDR